MGKHHWKVEKQPKWYVKAVRKTIAALPGGYAEAADWLDVTESALFNRLRADGDQIFPLGWAMVLQRAAGTHYIADAVAQSAGGVFVSLPEIEEVENADINQRLLKELCQHCHGKGEVSTACRGCKGKGIVLDEKRTRLHGTPVYKICGRCNGNRFSRLPTTLARHHVQKLVPDLTDYQWYKGYADVIDKLVTKCWQEEAYAEAQLRKVTR
ncbi:YmfL family putative regulatory protein [Escherichia coli]|uniref:YmfL family putative regulatory protein n=1 Tax=Escherichia coli TaxID=562 RepID=UPI000693A30A|nr:YmfL family putative regulatory protein [Escherichia coli]